MALTPRKRLGRSSGQALVEAAIGLSLMAFAWTLTFYAAYMVSHAGKCAAAARHAAWAAGNSAELGEDALQRDFFANNLPLVRLDQGAVNTSAASGVLSANALTQFVLRWFPQIQQAEVAFGLADNQPAETWPFVLTNSQFPFMPKSKMDEILMVSANCEWDTVSRTWDNPLQIMGDILTSITSMFAVPNFTSSINPSPPP